MRMGYVFSQDDALAWEAGMNKPCNQITSDLERRLTFEMLRPARLDALLDIGCGTGGTLAAFLERGIDASGLDPSEPVLRIARERVGHRASLHQGFAEDLPFDDNSFHYTCLIKTLEFVEDPRQALAEAFRVTRYRVFVGVLNPHSLKGSGLRVKRFFTRTLYAHARFFSIWDLKQMVREVAGNLPVCWKTIGQLPAGRITQRMEASGFVQRCPFGAFTGMTVTVLPRFRTRPLELIDTKMIGHHAAPASGGFLGQRTE